MSMDRLEQGICSRLLLMADDELVLGHRDSEWTGHAPILEEDIAFSNIAQDELGHAIAWYSLIEGLSGQDPDRLVYTRSAADFRNAPLVELPKRDWAFSMTRQYLFDFAESARLELLIQSAYRPLAELAAKISKEEDYHCRHTSAWMKRLSLGTDESHCRMQSALDACWQHAQELLAPVSGEEALVSEGIFPDPRTVKQNWEQRVVPFLRVECGLLLPEETDRPPWTRENHSVHLEELLGELQFVARLDPTAKW
jgi:ring-1,2-phenylacetyl-CoA epoxidase subunit PaaC